MLPCAVTSQRAYCTHNYISNESLVRIFSKDKANKCVQHQQITGQSCTHVSPSNFSKNPFEVLYHLQEWSDIAHGSH